MADEYVVTVQMADQLPISGEERFEWKLDLFRDDDVILRIMSGVAGTENDAIIQATAEADYRRERDAYGRKQFTV